MSKIKILTLLFLILSHCSNLLALDTKYAGEFLRIGLGVREMSLGGAVVANPQPSSAMFWNPAALAGNALYSGQLMHTEEFGGVLNLDQLAVVSPSQYGYNFGIGVFRLGVDDIPDTRKTLLDYGSDGIGPGDLNYSGPDVDGSENNGRLDPGERLDLGNMGTFGASESAFFVAVARPLNPKLRVGATFKVIHKSLFTAKAWGIGFDLGSQYQLNPAWQLGISLSDIMTTFLFWGDGEKELILPIVRLGTSYRLEFQRLSLQCQSLLGLDLGFQGEEHSRDFGFGPVSGRLRLGLEIHLKRIVVLRVGRNDLGGAQLGLGLETPIGQLDYGFAFSGSHNQLGQSHRLGLVIHFTEFARQLKRWL